MLSIKKCDAFLAKHHRYISPFVLAMITILTLNLITPTVLLAAEPRGGSPKPIEFQKLKPAPKRMITSSAIISSTTTKAEKASLERQRQAELKKLKDAVKKLEKTLVKFRSQLEKRSRTADVLSTVNIEKINNLVQILNDFKLQEQTLTPAPLPVPPTTTSTISTSTQATTSSSTPSSTSTQ